MPEFELQNRPELIGLIASSTTLGAIAGTVSTARICDSMGRKPTLVLSSLLFMLGAVVMGCAPTPAVLIGGRFVGGVAAGVVSAAVPTYIAECAEASLRGALSMLPQLCVSSGILLSYLVALAALIYGSSWRAMLAFSLLPALAQLACVLSLPESPRWLLSRRKDEAGALTALRRLRGTDDVAAELSRMKEGIERERPSAARATTGGGADGASAPRALLAPGVLRILLVCSALQMFQQLCGVNAIVYFTPQILKQAGAHNLFLDQGLSPNVAAMLATVVAYLPKIPSVRWRAHGSPDAREHMNKRALNASTRPPDATAQRVRCLAQPTLPPLLVLATARLHAHTAHAPLRSQLSCTLALPLVAPRSWHRCYWPHT